MTRYAKNEQGMMGVGNFIEPFLMFEPFPDWNASTLTLFFKTVFTVLNFFQGFQLSTALLTR
jgi:hypothetical protein